VRPAAVSDPGAAPAMNKRSRVSPGSPVAALVLGPFRVLILHWNTIKAFVRRDIHGRYVTSVMGLSWAIIQPLALLLLYTFLFSYILKIRFGAAGSTKSFAVYLFCGMLPWIAFSEGVVRASSVILEQGHLIKKVVFPSEILPAYVVLSALTMEMLGLSILVLAVALFYGGLGWSVLALPVIIVLQFMLTVGLAWLLASLNVFLRDVGQVLGLAMTLWMFLTPIFYPPEAIPPHLHWMLNLNPMYHVVKGYRDVIIEQHLPRLTQIGALAAMAFTAFLTGHWFFRRSKNAFVDVL
jgi:lipopolysaccharide transport system permease protein